MFVGIILPTPTPFADMQGYENFASAITLDGTTVSGKTFSTPITREHFKRLHGPHKRKVLYINALSRLPRVHDVASASVLWYGFCNNGPLAKEGLQLPENIKQMTITIQTKTEGRDDVWHFPVQCSL